MLDTAIANARILPVERKLWHNQLLQDFDGASAALANAKPQLNLNREGLTYHQAWVTFKEDRPELFPS